jgi:hypothetical protein
MYITLDVSDLSSFPSFIGYFGPSVNRGQVRTMATRSNASKETEPMQPPPRNSKGKGREAPSASNQNAYRAEEEPLRPPLSPSQGSTENGVYSRPPKWKGRYHGGKWYCDCNNEVKYQTCSRDVSNPNYLKKCKLSLDFECLGHSDLIHSRCL